MSLAREDYTSVSQIVEFLPGQTEKHIVLQINNDMRIEDNETFELYLIAGAGVNLTPLPRTEITIENDDGEAENMVLYVVVVEIRCMQLMCIVAFMMSVCKQWNANEYQCSNSYACYTSNTVSIILIIN